MDHSVCLDPRDLNKAILREYYESPTLDKIPIQMSGATFFTKLDS